MDIHAIKVAYVYIVSQASERAKNPEEKEMNPEEKEMNPLLHARIQNRFIDRRVKAESDGWHIKSNSFCYIVFVSRIRGVWYVFPPVTHTRRV